MTSTRPALPVPAEAVQALVAQTEPKTEDGPLTVVRAIAAPVAAAVLREEADRIAHAYHLSGPSFAAMLRERAAQISGETPRDV